MINMRNLEYKIIPTCKTMHIILCSMDILIQKLYTDVHLIKTAYTIIIYGIMCYKNYCKLSNKVIHKQNI